MHISNIVSVLVSISSVLALDMQFDDESSRNAGLKLIAKGLMDYYTGNASGNTPGMFSWPYYWWEAGAAWGSILDYWFYTGDDQYNNVLKSSLLFQVGANWDYIPSNQSTTEGNDDQAFWGITVMAAAEKNFTNPEGDNPSWAYLAQAVFNTMAWRWDTQYCNGGLRWQIFTWNNGYDYKNTVSNGCLFHMAARLARYTGNDSYIDWAEKVWDWAAGVGYIDTKGSSWPVYDGAVISTNCSDISNLEWTYNSGLFISGCAYLYNHTSNPIWLTRAQKIWARSQVFFIANTHVMWEAACQPSGRCNNDQRSFKGIFSRFLGLTSLLAPPMANDIQTLLQQNTPAILQSCSGGSDGHTCGLNWNATGWDGFYGLGEQMSALEGLVARLVFTRGGPLTLATGASSPQNASAGGLRIPESTAMSAIVVKGKDRIGAGFLTAIVLIMLLLATWWMIA